jgi:hypothetical protein
MENPPLSSGVSSGGSQFYGMGNPQHRVPSSGGNIYNPYHVTSMGMVPLQPFMNQLGGGYYPTRQGHGIYQNPGWSAISQTQSFPGAWAQTPQPRLPFLATLNLPDLSKLMNDPVHHDPSWPPIPTKLPSDIPKFEGKTGEDPGDHVTTFHLWCSSNSLNDDSIHLRLFQCTLMGVTMKWYIELPGGTYRTFNQMVLVFLNHFQLPVHYDVGLELLSTLHQDKATHISDHIQEWHRWKRLIKAYIPPEFLLEWFLKSLLPYISKDVSTSRVTSEEEAIFKAQQLDLIYAQSGMLYEILPDAPRSNYDPRQNLGPHVDGIIGSTNAKTTDLVTNQLKYLSLSQPVAGQASTSSSTTTQSTDVHSVQSSSNPNGNQQPGGNKRKGRGNNRKGGKNNNNKSKDDNNNDKSNNNVGEGKKEKWKVKFPCKLCKDDHLTHLCPKIEEASRLLSQPPLC